MRVPGHDASAFVPDCVAVFILHHVSAFILNFVAVFILCHSVRWVPNIHELLWTHKVNKEEEEEEEEAFFSIAHPHIAKATV